MNLIWVPNQQAALYLIAYCDLQKNPDSYKIFIQDEKPIPELVESCHQIGVEFVNKDFATKNQFNQLIIFSFGILSYQEEVVRSVKHKKLWVFGDFFNNTFYFHASALKWKVEGFIHIGFRLQDRHFDLRYRDRDSKDFVIPFYKISEWVSRVQHHAGIPSYTSKINPESFLFLDRYWGKDSLYPINDWEKFTKFIK